MEIPVSHKPVEIGARIRSIRALAHVREMREGVRIFTAHNAGPASLFVSRQTNKPNTHRVRGIRHVHGDTWELPVAARGGPIWAWTHAGSAVLVIE